MKMIFAIACLLFSSHPYEFNLTNSDLNLDESFKSNTIIDIEYLNQLAIISSSGGLGYSNLTDPNLSFKSYQNENLPIGGNPAMIVKDSVIVVSGSASVLDLGNYYPSGTGLSFSVDAGLTWRYMPQPIDEMPNLWSCSKFNYGSLFYDTRDECETTCVGCDNEPGTCARIYDYISWGNQN